MADARSAIRPATPNDWEHANCITMAGKPRAGSSEGASSLVSASLARCDFQVDRVTVVYGFD
jgi:hypothetical protein